MIQLTKNFHESEFACPCCGQTKVFISSVDRLQLLRDAYGKPIGIVEGGGFRCSNYASATSAHCNDNEGTQAFDLSYPREDHFKLIALAISLGFTGIGDKQKDGKFQLHIDDAAEIPGKRPRPWKWTY